MNDSEFIDLLNLYLDHEISAADAARLEAEVQTNPARRHIYHQYCRMQKACRMIAADFQTDSSDGSLPVEKKIIAFNPAVAATAAARRKRTNVLYAAGTFAALAACVAFIFAGRDQQAPATDPTASASPPVAVAPVSPIDNPDAVFVASKSAAPRGLVSVPPRQQRMLVRDPLLLTGNSQAEAVYAAAVHQANNQLAWIESVQLAPVQQRVPEGLHFAATLGSESRTLGNRSTPTREPQTGEEMVTFKFQK